MSAADDTASARDFTAYHRPALERDEVRHTVLIAILNRLEAGEPAEIRRWTLGEPGACAAQIPPYPIVLGDLTEAQCAALAEETRGLDYRGVVGADRTATWFADRATALGTAFAVGMPQKIHALRAAPRYPGAAGHARQVGVEDADLVFDWTLAFVREAVPHDPLPTREAVARSLADGRHMFWIVDGAPVSMAVIMRRVRDTAAISSVFTPPALRGRGYAGSVVAATVERIFAEGRSTACLYTDMRNPISNRCYAKIGFEPVCESWLYSRVAPAPHA